MTCTLHFFPWQKRPVLLEKLLVPFTIIESGPWNRNGNNVMLSEKIGCSRFPTLLKTNGRWCWFSAFMFFLCVVGCLLPYRKPSNCSSPAWKSTNSLNSSITIKVKLFSSPKNLGKNKMRNSEQLWELRPICLCTARIMHYTFTIQGK